MTYSGAVSQRRIRRPSETEISPASLAAPASEGENPPSAPVTTDIEAGQAAVITDGRGAVSSS